MQIIGKVTNAYAFIPSCFQIFFTQSHELEYFDASKPYVCEIEVTKFKLMHVYMNTLG